MLDRDAWNDIFSHLTNGVIVTDARGVIRTLNRAAESLLTVGVNEAAGRSCADLWPDLGQAVAPLIRAVHEEGTPSEPLELELELPRRGEIALRLRVCPVKSNGHLTTGAAIVIDDLTEQRRLEQQAQRIRRTFERYMSPQVVEFLLSDPATARLGGMRREVTILFADVRGFVSFGERVDPEFQINVLNRHMTLGAEAVLAEEGTLDKFMGDCMMAIFNAPLLQPDHPLRAVRAAFAMQREIAELHAHTPPEERLTFGIGIATGCAVVGNVGSPRIQTYTAIGDTVNLAYLLQSHARPGQILMSAQAYEQVCEHVIGHELGFVHLKGHTQPDLVFEISALRPTARPEPEQAGTDRE